MAVTMDDAQIRRVVAWRADNLELPSAVGLEKARTAGRRRIRWRRLAAVGSVLAVSAAVAIALSVIGSLGSAGQNGRIRHSMPAEPRRSPRSFNPLVLYASFGWLPSGARVTTFDLTRTLVSVETGPGRTQISLAVDAPVPCHLSGPIRYRFRAEVLRGAALARLHGPATASGSQPAPAHRRGAPGAWPPGVVELPAVRSARNRPEATLFWQFAPGAWAVVSVGVLEGGPRGPRSSAVRTELHKLADDVASEAASRSGTRSGLRTFRPAGRCSRTKSVMWRPETSPWRSRSAPPG